MANTNVLNLTEPWQSPLVNTGPEAFVVNLNVCFSWPFIFEAVKATICSVTMWYTPLVSIHRFALLWGPTINLEMFQWSFLTLGTSHAEMDPRLKDVVIHKWELKKRFGVYICITRTNTLKVMFYFVGIISHA